MPQVTVTPIQLRDAAGHQVGIWLADGNTSCLPCATDDERKACSGRWVEIHFGEICCRCLRRLIESAAEGETG